MKDFKEAVRFVRSTSGVDVRILFLSQEIDLSIGSWKALVEQEAIVVVVAIKTGGTYLLPQAETNSTTLGPSHGLKEEPLGYCSRISRQRSRLVSSTALYPEHLRGEALNQCLHSSNNSLAHYRARDMNVQALVPHMAQHFNSRVSRRVRFLSSPSPPLQQPRPELFSAISLNNFNLKRTIPIIISRLTSDLHIYQKSVPYLPLHSNRR